jgi:hypothetical protein
MSEQPENAGAIRADHLTRFKPGNPGKPKGARHALTENFIKALHDDFSKHGISAVEVVRVEKPDQYLKVIASLVPKDVNLNVNNLDELSDAELAERVRQLAETLAPFLAGGTGDANENAGGAEGAGFASRVH